MKLLYVGETWLGSCARSMREALSRRPGVTLEEFPEDAWFPARESLVLRAMNRLSRPMRMRGFRAGLLEAATRSRPDAVMTYKGTHVDTPALRALKKAGVATVNVYPDCSPHSSGVTHRSAVGEYDLVLSTKPFHPARWKDVYGYDNACEFVPQGYDPTLHLFSGPRPAPEFDVVMVATWRAEYGRLVREFAAATEGTSMRVAIGGQGWERDAAVLPRGWIFPGRLQGPAYVRWLLKGRICVAPVTREVVHGGMTQPGDEDTTRTYELGAAGCFFLHRRTDYLPSVYDERTEVPLFRDAQELAALVRRFLAAPEERERMAAAAHRRAVPAYSLDARAERILELLKPRLAGRR